jgi:hypothetical protein
MSNVKISVVGHDSCIRLSSGVDVRNKKPFLSQASHNRGTEYNKEGRKPEPEADYLLYLIILYQLASPLSDDVGIHNLFS